MERLLTNRVSSRGNRGLNFLFVVILALGSSLLFLAGLNLTALWGSSEARCAQVAREMYESGDYIVPQLDGHVNLTKPPVYHWLAALSYRVFGVGEFGARFPSGAAAALAVLCVYFLARRISDSVTGFLAGVMTATGIEFLYNARAARTDMVYTFFTTLAITVFLYATESRRHRRSLYVVFFACMGLAFMTKGPAGIFLPLVSGLGYLVFSGRKAEIRQIPWALGCLVFAAVTVPWHIAVAASVGAKTLKYYFWGQFARWSMGQTTAKSTRGVLLSLFLYVPYLLKGFFPWSFFLPAGLWAVGKDIKLRRNPRLILPFIWFLAGFLAFSLSGTKASRYMVPLLPAAAVIVAVLWRDAFSSGEGQGEPAPQARKLLIISLWPLVAVSIILSIAIGAADPSFRALRDVGALSRLNGMDSYMAGLWARFFSAHPWLFAIGGGFFALASVGALAGAYRGRIRYSFGLLAIVVAGFLSIFAFALEPRIDRIYNVRPFVERLDRLSAGAPYGWVGDGSIETLFYMGRPFDIVKPDDVKQYLEKNPQAVVLVWESDLPRLSPETLGYATELMRSRLKYRMAVVFGSPWRAPK